MGVVKRLLVVIGLLFAFNANSQLLTNPNVYGYQFRRLVTDSLFAPPADTFSVPVSLRTYPFIARKGTTVYLWNTSTFAWSALSGGGGGSVNVRRSIEKGTSDSLQLVNDSASFASGAVKVYGYDTNRGWKDAAKIVLTSPQDKDGLRYKASNATWVNYSLKQGRLQFISDVTADAPEDGDSLLTNLELYGKHIRVYRDGLMQMEGDIVEGFELTDSILTVHPPFTAGEEVVIETSDTTVWHNIALYTNGPAVDWVDLNFTTVNQLTHTDSSWTSTVGAGSWWDNYGKASVKIPAGEDGMVRIKSTGLTDDYQLIGVRTANTNGKYTTWDAGIGLVSNIYYVIESGSPSEATGGSVTSGEYLILRRTGSTLKMQKTTDFVTYTDLHTFAFSSSADLYILINAYQTDVVRYPKGYNVQ